jgi:hypothetical protein
MIQGRKGRFLSREDQDAQVERSLDEYEGICELIGKVGGRYFGFVFSGLRCGGQRRELDSI